MIRSKKIIQDDTRAAGVVPGVGVSLPSLFPNPGRNPIYKKHTSPKNAWIQLLSKVVCIFVIAMMSTMISRIQALDIKVDVWDHVPNIDNDSNSQIVIYRKQPRNEEHDFGIPNSNQELVSGSKMTTTDDATTNLPNIPYGIELGVFFPCSVTNTKTNRNKALQKISMQLKEYGNISSVIEYSDKHAIIPPQTWKLVTERGGFEIVSYLSPPLSEVQSVVEILHQKSNVVLHPQFNSIHINIDATNRTLEECKNAYTNFLLLEYALDTLFLPTSKDKTTKLSQLVGDEHTLYDELEESYLQETSLSSSSSSSPRNNMSFEDYYYHITMNTTANPIENFQQLINFGNTNTNYKRKRNRVGLILKTKNDGHYNQPKNFEFRGILSSLDPMYVIHWIQFAVLFMNESYKGKIVRFVSPNNKEQKREAYAFELLFDKLLPKNYHHPLIKKSFYQRQQEIGTMKKDTYKTVTNLTIHLCQSGYKIACELLSLTHNATYTKDTTTQTNTENHNILFDSQGSRIQSSYNCS